MTYSAPPHDLVVLGAALETMDDTGLDRSTERAFRALLERRRETLYRDALRRGRKAFADKPGKLRERVVKGLKKKR